MFLKTFDDRKNNPINGKHIYILATYRKEILNSLFKLPSIEVQKFKDKIIKIFKEQDHNIKRLLLKELGNNEGEGIRICIDECLKTKIVDRPTIKTYINILCRMKQNSLEREQEKLYKEWKACGIINMRDFVLVNAVNDKITSDLFKKLDNDKKPILLIINNTFFSNVKLDKYIDKTNILVIDECHSISAKNFLIRLFFSRMPIVL